MRYYSAARLGLKSRRTFSSNHTYFSRFASALSLINSSLIDSLDYLSAGFCSDNFGFVFTTLTGKPLLNIGVIIFLSAAKLRCLNTVFTCSFVPMSEPE